MSTKYAFLPAAIALAVLSGCGTGAMGSEAMRGIVLEYLGGQVGTVGPFSKGGKKELDVLAEQDRRKAEALIDEGAFLFLVYGSTVGSTPAAGGGGASRVVLVRDGKIVGDFSAAPKS